MSLQQLPNTIWEMILDYSDPLIIFSVIRFNIRLYNERNRIFLKKIQSDFPNIYSYLNQNDGVDFHFFV